MFPAEVERVMLDHPTIDQVAVVGFPEEVLGEQVVAFVVSASAVDDREVKLHCERHLASYKVPKQVIAVDELPRNPAGKVLKTQLRELRLPNMGQRDEADTQPEMPSLVALLRTAYASERRATAVSFVQQLVQQLADRPELPDPDEAFLDAGLDSLMIVELRDRLQVEVGPHVELPATMVFDHPTLRDFASFLADVLLAADVELATGPDANDSRKRSVAMFTSHAAEQQGSDSAALAVPGAVGDHQLPGDIESMSAEEALEELFREMDD